MKQIALAPSLPSGDNDYKTRPPAWPTSRKRSWRLRRSVV